MVSSQFAFPLTVDIAQYPNAQGTAQVTSISQTYGSTKTDGANPPSSLVESVETTDTLQFDPNFNLIGNSNQKSLGQATGAANGKCVSILTTAANNVITGQTSGKGCQ